MRLNRITAILFASASAAALQVPVAQAQTKIQDYGIKSQPLADALRKFSEISGREVVAPDANLDGKQSPGAHGSLSPDEAIHEILSNTGLEVSIVDNAYVVHLSNSKENVRTESTDDIVVTGTRIRGVAPAGSPLVTIDRADIEKSGIGSVQQLLQTLPQAFGGGPNETTLGATTRNGAGTDGTYASSINLRGLGPSSTLVLIDGIRPALGGLGGVFADISLIPVNAIERVEILTDGASAIYGADAVAGVVNLRLRNQFEGAETILRFGTADGDMNTIQFSQIVGKKWNAGQFVLAYQYSDRGSLAAADRNFAREDLRQFGGPDYRSRFAVPGTIIAADGQSFAIPNGQDGRALQPIDLVAGTKNLRDMRAASDLLPHQRTHSVYAAGELLITDNLSWQANLLASQRRYRKIGLSDALSPTRVPVTNPFYVDPIGTGQPVTVNYSFVNDLGPQINTGWVRGLTASTDLEQSLGQWKLQFGGSYGRQKGRADNLNMPNRIRLAAALADTDPDTAFNVFGDGSANNPATIASIRGSLSAIDAYTSWSMSLRADGPLMRLPADDIRLAIGAEFRREQYQSATINDLTRATATRTELSGLPGPRNVRSAYAELLVPIFGPNNAEKGLHRLVLSLAGRIEDYNDVGRTTNPKLGLSWEPLPGLALRGSYGTSFRAPAFDELIGPSVSLYTTLQVPDPAAPTGVSNVLALFGYAPGIKPEKATTWTAGVDIKPPAIPKFKASLTYYNVDYRDRIGTASEDYARFLTRRDIFSGVITDNPSPQTLAYYFGFPTFSNPLGLAPTDIVAILDGQIRNLSAEHQTGFDFDLGYTLPLANGTLDLDLAGSHIFKIDRQLTPGAPASDVVGTFANPVKWRLRGQVGWSKDGFSATAHVNYSSGYLNQVVTPAETVSGWTTVDINLSQKIGSVENSHGLRLGLSILNLFDADPPYMNNKTNTSALAYDPEKASPTGRVIALQATAQW